MNGKQWMVVIILDVLVLAELVIGVYVAGLHPDDFTLAFIKSFFGMLIPTLIIGICVKRFLRQAPQSVKS
jgi:uncharacterized ion transporter superfamily protein YfcC